MQSMHTLGRDVSRVRMWVCMRSSGVVKLSVRCAAAAAKPSATPPQHVTIVGGGAAGLTAAYFAAREGAKVTVLERTSKCGTKILMSGGTRCNVLPAEVELQKDFFTGGSNSAMKAVFASWPLEECKAWLEDSEEGLGLPLSLEPETLKYFPTSNSSREVRDRLVSACSRLGVTFRYNSSVEGIRPVQQEHTAASASISSSSSNGHLQPSLGSRTGSGDVSQREEASSSAPAAGRAHGRKGRREAGVESRGQAAAQEARRPIAGWVCELKDGEKHHCDRLVISTGGMSFPGVGTDGSGHRMMRQLGLELRETYPALTPLVGPHPGGENLAGLSLYTVQAQCQVPGLKKLPRAARSDMLFTHKGFSGPAVLDLSHHAIKALKESQAATSKQAAAASRAAAASSHSAAAGGTAVPPKPGSSDVAVQQPGHASGPAGPTLCVNWTGEPAAVWEDRLKAGGLPLVSTVLRRNGIRERLADALCEELGLQQKKLSQLQGSERAALVAALTRYPLSITGSEGYKKAEVTGGGVPLEQLNCATMEIKALPGLHLCGEILDVFGRIGGFNFYWAWVSGRLAGIGAALGADTAAVSRSLQEQKGIWVQWKEDW